MIRKVDDGAIEAVCDCRAGRTPCCVVRSEHEVIDEQLRASAKQIREGRRTVVRFEVVLLVDPNPGQLAALPRHFVAALGQRLLGVEQLQPSSKPLRTCSCCMTAHDFSPRCRANRWMWCARCDV